MSLKALAWAWEQELPATIKMVLLALADCHNAETNQCNPSVKYIGSKAGLKDRSVAASLKRLTDLGLLHIHHNYRDDGSLTSSSYTLWLPGVVVVAIPSLGSALSDPGSALSAPANALSAPHEPGIEPGREPPEDTSVNTTVSSGVRAEKKPAATRITRVDDAFREQMRQRFGPTFGDTVQERIDEALGHKSAKKYDDLQSYVRGWLRRDAERVSQEVNGVKPNPDQGRTLRVSALAKYGTSTPDSLGRAHINPVP